MGGDDRELVARLRSGDEEAFTALVDCYHPSLLRLATALVPNRAVAEEVVQDTWLGVVRGIEAFEGRSSLKTWLFRILVNRARSAGSRERRYAPARLGSDPAVPPERFGADGRWVDPPAAWAEEAEERLAAKQMAGRVRACLDELPPAQRQVILLRDVEGLPPGEVCAALGISDGNQRVLLHRARSRVRRILEREIGKG